ncbi:hypothetical protein [Chlorogloea sp. CCALA 695]|uniref:hypothetical protein n=1 Tax=Chlorogloea sp. CCALA 695 TaxID=2107693 RepID=UPI000D04E621|nr:hypothetical protein [Chlorogloea sp. CCALA 695]PSB32774.1 hypothetical protein C7B70_09620 [Chlorogloea sp. CCALA 695]
MLSKRQQLFMIGLGTSLIMGSTLLLPKIALSLPPITEIPEEVLRTEIITSARSPIDGKLLTAAQYAEVQIQLQDSPPLKLSPKVRETIFLLRLRQLIRTFAPFLPI